jgi:hypothetical protein
MWGVSNPSCEGANPLEARGVSVTPPPVRQLAGANDRSAAQASCPGCPPARVSPSASDLRRLCCPRDGQVASWRDTTQYLEVLDEATRHDVHTEVRVDDVTQLIQHLQYDSINGISVGFPVGLVFNRVFNRARTASSAVDIAPSLALSPVLARVVTLRRRRVPASEARSIMTQ